MHHTKAILFSLLGFTIVVSLFMSSCTEPDFDYNVTTYYRPCENVYCLNGGSCLDGRCICPDGYEGESCEIKWNERFIGDYHAYDDCYTGAGDFYNSQISAVVTSPDMIRLTNVGTVCASATLNAVVSPEKTSFQIPPQNTCGDIWVSGSGNLNNNSLSIALQARDSVNHSSTHCSMVLDKQ